MRANRVVKPLDVVKNLPVSIFKSINFFVINPAQESFHSLLKKEWFYHKKIYTFEDAYREIFNYIEGFYNPIRTHSSIGYLSPNIFEKNLSV